MATTQSQRETPSAAAGLPAIEVYSTLTKKKTRLTIGICVNLTPPEIVEKGRSR